MGFLVFPGYFHSLFRRIFPRISLYHPPLSGTHPRAFEVHLVHSRGRGGSPRAFQWRPLSFFVTSSSLASLEARGKGRSRDRERSDREAGDR